MSFQNDAKLNLIHFLTLLKNKNYYFLIFFYVRIDPNN